MVVWFKLANCLQLGLQGVHGHRRKQFGKVDSNYRLLHSYTARLKSLELRGMSVYGLELQGMYKH